MSTETYLPEGMPRPAAAALDGPYWKATLEHRLVVQQCSSCGRRQWGPEWICWRCHSFDLGWTEVTPRGRIFSWERPWHPVHSVLAEAVPYIVALVELDDDTEIRMVGNLVGDRRAEVAIGTPVEAVFEDHDGYTLVHWAVRPNQS